MSDAGRGKEAERGERHRMGWVGGRKARVLWFKSRAHKWRVVGKDCRAASQISSIRVGCAFREILRDAFTKTIARIC